LTSSGFTIYEVPVYWLIEEEFGAKITQDNLPDDSPQIAIDGANATVIWAHTMDTNLSSLGMEIYYAMWNGSNWTEAEPLTENDNIELDPALTYDSNGNIVAVWTADKGANLSELEVWLADLELYYSIWNETAWSAPELLTNNSFGDGKPSIAADNAGNVMLVWLTDADSNISTMNDLDLYYAVWNGSTWTEPAPITNDSIWDSKQKVAYGSSGDAIAVWVRDLDGNSSTVEDREIYYYLWNGSTWAESRPITDNSVADTSPSVTLDSSGTAELVWIHENISSVNVTYTNSTTNTTYNTTANVTYKALFTSTYNSSADTWSEPEIVGVFARDLAEPSIKFDSRNNAILVWRGYGNSYGDVYYRVRDNVTGLWSPLNKLTDDDLIDWKISLGVDYEDNAMVTWLKHNYSIECEANASNCTIYYTYDDLFYDKIIVKPDLSPVNISFSTDNPVIGESVTINASIHNLGVVKADSISVRFFDGDPISGVQIGEDQLINSLAAGENETVSVNWTALAGEHEIYVVVDPLDNTSESNESNNIAFKSFGCLPDLSIVDSNITFEKISTPRFVLPPRYITKVERMQRISLYISSMEILMRMEP
jgi:hypothetical protein